jgi:predicted XRE-type DNA-binding protein
VPGISESQLSGSGPDSGHPRPAEALAKGELARKIGAVIERRGLTQAVAAEILEVDQPNVLALKRGRLAGFSLVRLLRFLVLLGSDVKIVVKPRASSAGQARVTVA